MNLYLWCNLGFGAAILAIYFGAPLQFGRVVAGVFWLLMLLTLVFGSRL